MLHLSYAAHSASVSVLTQGDVPSMVAYSSPETDVPPDELLPAGRVMSVADSMSMDPDGSMVAQVDAEHVVMYRPAAGKRDEYELLSVVGKGGMGVVFRARERASGRIVAVKRPLFARGTRRNAARGLMREWGSARSVNHPSVVRSLAADIDQEGPYLVSEFIEGRDLLRALIDDGPMPPALIGRIAMAVCHATGHAHATGLIHRDLKPSNIMLDQSGRAFVLDFGLARGMMEIRSDEAGRFLGTPGYTAPEQAMNASKADHRADFYSLGVTFYHLLTGLPDGKSQPPALSLPWLFALSRAAAPNPQVRHLNAAELMRDLRGAFEPEAGRCICCREALSDGPACAACGADQMFHCPSCATKTRIDRPACGHCAADLGFASRMAAADAYLGALLQAGERHAAVQVYETMYASLTDRELAQAYRNRWAKIVHKAKLDATHADRIANSTQWATGPVDALLRYHEASKHDSSYRDAYMHMLAEVNPAAYLQQFEAPLTPEELRRAEEAGDEITINRHLRERAAAANLAAAAGTKVDTHELTVAAAAQARVKSRWRRNTVLFIAVAALLIFGYAGCATLMKLTDDKPPRRNTYSVPSKYR